MKGNLQWKFPCSVLMIMNTDQIESREAIDQID